MTASPPAAPVPGRWHCDWLVGLPTGLRSQLRLNDDPAEAWLIEGFLGVEIILPTAGAGVRRRFVCRDDGRWSHSISPGVGCYAVYAVLGGAVAVVGDVDFIWSKRTDNGGSFDCGLKLGAGPGHGGFVLSENRTIILPVASVILGWHY